jgi:peptide/nickel transport system permease protein
MTPVFDPAGTVVARYRKMFPFQPYEKGPRPAEATGAIEVPKGPNVDLSAVDPLAPRYKEWDERAAKFRTVEFEKLETLPMGADRLGRDVLAKAIKGS